MEKNSTGIISAEISDAIALHQNISRNQEILDSIDFSVTLIVKALQQGKKILLAGNGGSAADAQHIAGEFVSKFNYDRPGLAAFALTVDTSVITAIGNDYGYEKLFQRQLQAVAQSGDIFWCYSTSGKSKNILSAISEAKKLGLITIGFTGADGFISPYVTDITFKVPSKSTPRIQECHLLLGHIICGQVESEIFPND